jgi:integrase
MNERSDGHVRELAPGNWMFGVRLGTRRRYLKRAGYPTKTAADRARKAVLELVREGRGDEWYTDRIVDLVFERTRPGRTLPGVDELRRLRGAGLDPTAPSKLVGDYAQEWWATKADKRPSTQAILRHRVDKHIRSSELGGLPLDRVTRTDVKDFLDGCTTLGPRAKQQLRATLKSIFQTAVEDGLLPRNPAAQVKTPPPPTRRPTTWTREERDRFLAHVEDDPLHPLLATMVRTGLRRGEACGLRWCDLNLDAADPYLQVEQQITYGPGGTFEVGDPKTNDSRRTVMLDPVTVAVLEAHRMRQLQERMALGLGRAAPNDFAFGRWDHRRQAWLPHLPNAVAARFKRLCRQAGVTVIAPHALRHTYATLLVEAGVPDRVIADQLGHRDTRFTASVYVHPPQATRAAILARAEGWEAGS